MKRLLAIVVAVGVFAIYVTSPAFGQGAANNLSETERHALEMKSWVKSDAISHPKWRVLISFRDGTQAAGRIREVHENDFVLAQSGNFPSRTIAYSELAIPPRRIQPMAEKIAEYTGCTILVIVFFPLLVFMGLTGDWD